jgi:hypothetical protein
MPTKLYVFDFVFKASKVIKYKSADDQMIAGGAGPPYTCFYPWQKTANNFATAAILAKNPAGLLANTSYS